MWLQVRSGYIAHYLPCQEAKKTNKTEQAKTKTKQKKATKINKKMVEP
jgi:hypothetical protein